MSYKSAFKYIMKWLLQKAFLPFKEECPLWPKPKTLFSAYHAQNCSIMSSNISSKKLNLKFCHYAETTTKLSFDARYYVRSNCNCNIVLKMSYKSALKYIEITTEPAAAVIPCKYVLYCHNCSHNMFKGVF